MTERLWGRERSFEPLPHRWARSIVRKYAKKHGDLPFYTIPERLESMIIDRDKEQIIRVKTTAFPVPYHNRPNRLPLAYQCEVRVNKFEHRAVRVGSFFFQKKKDFKYHLGDLLDTVRERDFTATRV